MTQDDAELLALRALAWIAGNQEVMSDFLNATGSDATTLRQYASAPETLGSVMDFVMGSDAMVMSACDGIGCSPAAIIEARAHLSGGAERNWT